jgi:hypothetical protein
MTEIYAYDPQLALGAAIRRSSFDGVNVIVYLATAISETEIKTETRVNGLAFSMQSGDRILSQTKYVLQVSDPIGKSDYSGVPKDAMVGSVVDLSVNCDYGYEVVGANLIYADGKRERVDVKFIMPAEPVSIELIVERIVFHITFEVDGQVYKQMDLFFEDLLVPPEDPTKAEDDSYTYSFDGWSPQLWNKAVDRSQPNPVFKAVFTAHPKVALAADDYQGSLVIRVIVIGLLGMTLLVGSILCLVHRKRVGGAIRRGIKGFAALVTGKTKRATEDAADESRNLPTSSEDAVEESMDPSPSSEDGTDETSSV